MLFIAVELVLKETGKLFQVQFIRVCVAHVSKQAVEGRVEDCLALAVVIVSE